MHETLVVIDNEASLIYGSQANVWYAGTLRSKLVPRNMLQYVRFVE